MSLTLEPEVIGSKYADASPGVCPKPNCGGVVFFKHVDGWQCFNCNKIIYREEPVIGETENLREGHRLYR